MTPGAGAVLSGKELFMKNAFDSSENVALLYIRSVRRESQEAAAAIERIRTDFGAHAAIRAALIITLLRIEVRENHWLPSMGHYAHLLADYPDALPLTTHAMRCCLRSWNVPIVETGEWVALATV
jgi:hypothetical protein